MNKEEEYAEISEEIGFMIGCGLAAFLIIAGIVCIVALPFLAITLLTSSPGMI